LAAAFDCLSTWTLGISYPARNIEVTETKEATRFRCGVVVKLLVE
jgi:hypothetical protein